VVGLAAANMLAKDRALRQIAIAARPSAR